MKEFIHIRVPKTASTMLQEHVFAKTPAIKNVGRPFDNPDDAQLLNGLALDDDRDFREERIVAHVSAGRARGVPVPVYSDETVVNTPIRSTADKRLQRLMPDAHIIAVVRENLRPDAGQVRYQALRIRFLRGVPLPRTVPGAPALKRGAKKLLGSGGLDLAGHGYSL